MIILKVTKKQGFMSSLENTFLEKPHDPPAFLGSKTFHYSDFFGMDLGYIVKELQYLDREEITVQEVMKFCLWFKTTCGHGI